MYPWDSSVPFFFFLTPLGNGWMAAVSVDIQVNREGSAHALAASYNLLKIYCFYDQ